MAVPARVFPVGIRPVFDDWPTVPVSKAEAGIWQAVRLVAAITVLVMAPFIVASSVPVVGSAMLIVVAAVGISVVTTMTAVTAVTAVTTTITGQHR